jgi:hypothetical protein
MQAMPYIACFFCASRRRLSPSGRWQSHGRTGFCRAETVFLPDGNETNSGLAEI